MINITRQELCSKISEALAAYSHLGNADSCIPYGNGHINDTFLLVIGGKKYILQRINHFVFPHPDEIMSNIVRVTAHITAKSKMNGIDTSRCTLHVVPDNNDNPYFKDSIGSFWRIYDFVDETVSIDKVESSDEFYKCAKAFGEFQLMLSDFPADNLYETIHDFHNTPKRFNAFEEAVKKDVCGRTSLCHAEIAAILEHKELSECLEKAHNSGKLPLRVTHNDTKLNNILFDTKTLNPVCVIDLDTVMPGYSVNDFGDSIRFGANTASEDEKDLSNVSLDLDLFRLYTKGFLEKCGKKLTSGEISLLPYGAMVMTFECGMRFLTDYLNGDTYFRIHYPDHNLVRCRTQLFLLADMESKLAEMKKAVSDIMTDII